MVTAAVAAPEEQPFFAPDPVELNIGFGSPPRQSRVTVAFRILLAVPHLVVLYVLGLVAVLLAIVGWFAALVLGRLPRWIARYEIGVIAYSTRVNAYVYLLADKFPPFGFSAADYSIAVKIGASRLSRLKVLFRWLLFIPAGIVASIALNGLLVLSPIIWLVTLVLGRMPQPFFTAVAAVIRYQARYSAYMSLVTDEYPHRLFGDGVSGWAPEGFRVSVDGGGEWVMRLIVALGIVAAIVSLTLPVALRPKASPALVAAEARLESASRTYLNAVQGCGTGTTALRCIETGGRAWGQAFGQFASSLSRVSFSGSQAGQASTLAQDARKLGQSLLAASQAKTAVEYQKAFLTVQRLLPTFEADAKSLLGHGL